MSTRLYTNKGMESVDRTESPIQLWFNTTAFSDQYGKARILLLQFHVVVLDEISKREKMDPIAFHIKPIWQKSVNSTLAQSPAYLVPWLLLEDWQR